MCPHDVEFNQGLCLLEAWRLILHQHYRHPNTLKKINEDLVQLLIEVYDVEVPGLFLLLVSSPLVQQSILSSVFFQKMADTSSCPRFGR